MAKNKELWIAFVDLEKAFDRVPREVVWCRDLHGPSGPAGRAGTGRSGPGSQTDKVEPVGPGFLIQQAGPGFTFFR